MTPSTEFREPTASRPRDRAAEHTAPSLKARVKLVTKNAILWSYERGSWQYDIIVLLILAFIFLTPAGWFHSRPHLQLSDLRHVQGIVEVGHTDQTWVYQLDARLVESLGAIPPRKAIHQLLRQRIKPPFEVESIKPIRGKGDVILGYTVAVKR